MHAVFIFYSIGIIEIIINLVLLLNHTIIFSNWGEPAFLFILFRSLSIFILFLLLTSISFRISELSDVPPEACLFFEDFFPVNWSFVFFSLCVSVSFVSVFFKSLIIARTPKSRDGKHFLFSFGLVGSYYAEKLFPSYFYRFFSLNSV